tara:strand:- start:4061 stop:4735 length:675 start_codon:yes stop_codon:yes gene_type:complete
MQFVEMEVDVDVDKRQRRCVMLRPMSASAFTSMQEDNKGMSQIHLGPFRTDFPLTASQKAVLRDLAAFYTEPLLREVLHPYVIQSSPVSLRALDWLVTNYSKARNVVCVTPQNRIFNIFKEYKLALAIYRRRNFDPFRRRLRISYVLDGVTHSTTVGQANFMQWAHKNGVLRFAASFHQEIEKDMNAASAHSRTRTGRLKRQELSTAPTSRCNVYKIASTLVLV